ncbi:ABC transporter substrate-binding protein [Oceanimonas sp. NS1]|nr:ABC transporter substrate-binding protein [Oceanimonas sp. NS1]
MTLWQTTATACTLALSLAALAAQDGPGPAEKDELTLGFIKLTDMAPWPSPTRRAF